MLYPRWAVHRSWRRSPEWAPQGISLGNPSGVATADGTSETAQVTVLTVAIDLGARGSATIEFLPLTVRATAPAGGVECVLPAPTITTPADGATTNDTTPTISATGVAGATVRVSMVQDGVAFDETAAVAASGFWSLTASALDDDRYTVRARQTLGGLTSEWSETNRFTVDTTVAIAITPPADGNSLTDATQLTVAVAPSAVPPELANTGSAPRPLLAMSLLLLVLGAGQFGSVVSSGLSAPATG